jgi:signal transduction histidine kinase
LFQNLLDNAIKFRSHERPVVRVSSEPESDGHIIRVADNGIGIEPEHHEAVFRILHRLPRSRELPGTGIGLAICKKIVECHGGRIWIESERDQGATVLVWLPGADKAVDPGMQ